MKNTETKWHLWKKNKYCHWCGVKTRPYKNLGKNGDSKPDMATVDHIVSRNFAAFSNRASNKVLSCYKCNQDRAKNEQKLIPKYREDNKSYHDHYLFFLSGKI